MVLNLGLNLKQEILAVDLGQNCIKVYRLQKTRAGIKATEMITAETGYDPALPPEEFQEKRNAILSEIWQEHKFKKRDVMLSIPGRGAIVRQFRIPRVSGERLDRMVRFEAKQQIPIPLDQVILDYHYFDSGEPELEVSLIAIRKNAVEEYVSVLKEAKLRPDLIDAAPLCLFNIFAQEERPPEDVVAIIDIGASETNIVIYQDRVVKFIRSAPVGGNLLTEALAGQLDMSFAEAEEVKRSLGSIRLQENDLSSDEIQERTQLIEIVESGLDKIYGEIRRSIDFFISKPEGEALTHVILTGGTSRFQGIEEQLEERLGVPVDKADAFETEAVDTTEIEATGLSEISASGLGLALRATDKSILSMNFIPPSVKEEKAIRGRMISLVLEGVLLALMMVAIVLHLNSELEKYNSAIDYLDNILNREKLGIELQEQLEKSTKMNERFETLQAIIHQRGLLANLLFEIAAIAPPEIWVTRFQGAPQRIFLFGKCEIGEKSKISDFVDLLSLSPYFGQVDNPVQKPVGNNYEFEIVIDKLTQPSQTEVALIETLTKKRIDVAYANIQVMPNKPGALVLSIYGNEEEEVNNQTWPEIVDALVSSGVDVGRVEIYWMNRLGKVMYRQLCRYEFCIALQKDEIGFEEFIGEKVKTLPFEPVVEKPKQPTNEELGLMEEGL